MIIGQVLKVVVKNGELEIPIYDEDKRKITDLKNNINKDGDLNIDVYYKNDFFIK